MKSTRTNYKEVEVNLKSKDMTIRRISKDNPYGGYVSGYLVGDNVLPFPHRWQRLDDVWENCCVGGRLSDGMARR
jgi:hypothetical protein